MNSYKNIWALSFCFLLGCSDFLKVEPQNKYLDVNYYKTENQVFQGLVAAYDPLEYTFVDGKWTSSVMLAEIWSDNANAGGDNSNFDQPGWQQIDDLKFDGLTAEARSFWKKYYIGINKTNQVLNNVKIESDLVSQYKAEAKFLRAFYHFELVRTFGPIPVLTKQPAPSDKNFKRNTLSEVYTQITTDLLEAIPLLPKRSEYPGNFAGRVTKGAAQALLGKAYIYWADLKNDDKTMFDKAAEQFKAVIDSDEYQLVDDYKNLFAFGAANPSESVFEIQYTNKVAADFSTPYAFINGNMMIQLCGIRGLCKKGFSNNTEFAPGWGFMLPTENLYSSFLPDDTYRRDAAVITEDELAAETCPLEPADQNQADYTGYWQRKYANYKDYSAPGGEINVLKDGNQPYIRYADVLLMYAESLVRGNGSSASALLAIDQVRERAAGPGNNTGNFKTASTIMTEEGWSALDLIWYERRAEFAGEGDRWFDLVRSGRAVASIFPNGDLRHTNFNEHSLYLPIPQREVDITGDELTQYPDDPTLFN